MLLVFRRLDISQPRLPSEVVTVIDASSNLLPNQQYTNPYQQQFQGVTSNYNVDNTSGLNIVKRTII